MRWLLVASFILAATAHADHRQPVLCDDASANDVEALKRDVDAGNPIDSAICVPMGCGDRECHPRPIVCAAQHDALDAVKWLIAHKVSVAPTDDGDDAFDAAVGSNSTDTVEWLLASKHATIDEADRNGPAIVQAAARERAEMMETLLAHGASVGARDADGRTPLHVASTTDVVKILLDHDADVGTVDNSGRTPLHAILESAPTLEVVNLLLAAKAPLEAADKTGSTPLLACFASRDKKEVCERLLQAGASVNVAGGRDGGTPLEYAVIANDAALVTELLDHHEDPNVRDDHGWTALDGARLLHHGQIAAQLAPLTKPDPAFPRFPWLAQIKITADDVSDLSVDDLVIARNEIYARRGYKFQHADLAAYFAKQTWYKPDPAFDEKKLSDVELSNIHVLLTVENSRKK
jgi:ankyrin repeat protein